MTNEYFMELYNLKFDQSPQDEPNPARDALSAYIPKGKGVIARLHNQGTGNNYFDYVAITEDMVYFAVLFDGPAPTLRSVKYFKSSAMVAFGFVLEAMDRAEEDVVPQLRLMLRDDRRIKLVLNNDDHDYVVKRLQEISTKNFFLAD